MKLKTLFFLLALLLLGAWGILFFFTLKERGTLVYVGEAVITLSLIVLVYFYRKVVQPLNSIANGMDLLREQDFSSRLAPVRQAEADRIVDMFNRMMDQLKNERLRLREQNHFLDLLINVSPMGVVILDFDGKISMLNAAALRFLGYTAADELAGKSFQDLDAPLAGEIARLPRDTVETIRLSDAMIYRCSRLSFIDRGFAHPFVLIESLTTEVVKAEKKAYEKVIRMIAHEVNNTVAGVTSTLDTLETAMEDMPDSAELCELMRVCIERCYNMGRFITNFADVVKIPDPILVHSDLNEVVRVNMQFLETMCGERRIALVMHLSPEPVWVDLDVVLFQQVLVNIFKNAVESIGQEGTVYIRTSAGSPVLEVADTGRGIDKETASKLFSPFFSTKPNGQGIGLMLVREVLMKHHCTFSLRTGDDGLTRFTIHFPFP